VLLIILSGARSSTSDANSHAYVAIGLSLAAMIYAFDHVSGAHFNPAVTLATVIVKKMHLATAASYVVAQTLGGMAGALIAFMMVPPASITPFIPTASAGAAFGVEALYTFALILVQQNAAAEKNAREPNSYFGLSVAFTVLAGARAVGPISGGCFNPAVGVGLDFIGVLSGGGTGASFLWLYWAGPLLGAVLASYTKIYMNHPVHASAPGLPLVVPLTEAIGTALLVCTASLTNDGLAVGAILLALVYMGDHVCGADYNPAVTIGVALRMGVPPAEYWKVAATCAAQFAGGMLGALMAYGFSGRVGFPNVDGIRGVVGAVCFEALWTALLVYVVCAVMTPIHGVDEAVEERRGHSKSYQGLAIGFVVAGGIYCGGASGGGSGGVFNPAVGSAITAMDVAFQGGSAAHLWVYWVGPLSGSLLGAGLFSLLHYQVGAESVLEGEDGGFMTDPDDEGYYAQ
jgi:aquaporin Z